MSREWWQRVENLYHAARELDRETRSGFLDHACASDDAVRAKVEELLAQDERPETFLGTPALAASAIALSPGTKLGPYEVLDPIGAGGMGEVFRAHDSRLKRDVAIKTLPAEFASDSERLARFEREARLLASLNHPNIAAIHDIVENGNGRYLVLELVEGPTLAERLKKGRVTLEEALPIARQIAEAIEAAHAKGIVHRDLTPANIKVMPDGKVKVLDFGLAKMFANGGPITDRSQAPTHDGEILGTPAYMSPEQARGDAVDERTDIWAFGCVVYELVTGRKAFEGDTVSDTIASVLKSVPDWSRIPSDTPSGLLSLLRRCLSKDVRRRIHSASDVRIELEEIEALPHSVPETATPRNGKRNRLVLALMACVLVLAGTLTVTLVYTRSTTGEAGSVRFLIYPPDGYSFAGELNMSPDGRHVAFLVRSKGRRVLIAVRSLDSLNSRVLEGTDGARSTFWSGDSRSIGFVVQEQRLKAIDIGGGSPRTLFDAPVAAGTWNKNGVIVFAARNRGSVLYRASSGGPPEPLDIVEVEYAEGPRFLPDGSHFIYDGLGPTPERRGTYIAALDSKETERILDIPRGAQYAPPGYLVFERDGAMYVQGFDASSGRLSGKPIATSEPSAGSSFSFSMNGVMAARKRSVEKQLAWFSRQGEKLKTIDDAGKDFIFPQLSPDGKWIAVTGSGAPTSNQAVFLIDVMRGVWSRWTLTTWTDQNPVWSPDGKQIVFNSQRGRAFDLYRGSSSSQSGDESLYTSAFNKQPDDWSTDGRFLLYQERDAMNRWDLSALPLPERKDPIRITQTSFDEVEAQFSPDGHWIAYASNESGDWDVYIQDFPNGAVKRKVSISGGDAPRWRHDGSELFYATPDRHLMSVPIQLQNLDAQGAPHIETPVALFQADLWQPNYPVAPFAVKSDGQRFLLNVLVESSITPITVTLNWKPPQE